MRNIFTTAAAIAMIATPAYAGGHSSYPSNGRINIDNSGDQIIEANPSAAIERGAVRIDNSGDQLLTVAPDIDNTSRSEALSLSDSVATSSGNDTSVSYSSEYRQSAMSAIAPTMIAACGAGGSAAGSGRSFSAALGIPFGLQTCQRIQLAGALAGFGATSAACELLRDDKRVARALDRAGVTCTDLIGEE